MEHYISFHSKPGNRSGTGVGLVDGGTAIPVKWIDNSSVAQQEVVGHLDVATHTSKGLILLELTLL